MSYKTGYYGIPGTLVHSKVHVTYDGKPMCGWRPRKQHQFQWCANRIWLEVIECLKCKAIARNKTYQSGISDL